MSAKLEKRLRELQAKKDRAEGTRQALLDRLKDKFNCSSIKKGEALLEELKLRRKELKSSIEEAKASFEEKYGEKLDAIED